VSPSLFHYWWLVVCEWLFIFSQKRELKTCFLRFFLFNAFILDFLGECFGVCVCGIVLCVERVSGNNKCFFL
jgi:hypothetical protein